MMIAMIVMKVEFGSMEKHEIFNALKGDPSLNGRWQEDILALEETDVVNSNGKVVDLIIPIICLVICCIIGMIYTGGFFSGVSFSEHSQTVMHLLDFQLEACSDFFCM